MKTKGLYLVVNPEPPAPPVVTTAPTLPTYGGITPPFAPIQQVPQQPQISYYPTVAPMYASCCPRPNTCLRELDRCGLNGTNSGTYDPEGVTDEFIKDVEAYEIPVFGKGTGNEEGGQAGSTGSPYQSPPYVPAIYGKISKVVQFIDVAGEPLEGAHVTWPEAGKTVGTTTNSNGEATITVPSTDTVVKISFVGKRTHVAKYSDLGSMITLQNNVNNLPPVVVGGNPPASGSGTEQPAKKSNMVRNIAIGVGALFLLSAVMSKGKTGKASRAVGLTGTKSKRRKTKKTGKKRKGLREPAPEIEL